MPVNPEQLQNIAGAGMAGANIISRNFGQPGQDVHTGYLPDGRIDVKGISDQEYQGRGFDIAAPLQGAAAGASFGPVGAAIGGGMGILSAVGGLFRNQQQKREFEREKRRKLRNALSVNAGIDYRDMKARNLGYATQTQLDRYLNSLM